MNGFTHYWEADLHCHTTASDGLLTPTQLVKLASERGVLALGITDHDTIQGWMEAEEAGLKYGVEIVRGIELNTDHHGTEVHILGYEIDRESAYLHSRLRTLREARRQRMLEIIDRLEKLGIKISEADVQKKAQGESIGRPHIAQVLVEQGYAQNNREAFDRYIGPGAPAYVPRFKLSPVEGIHLIREARGIAVLAHPGCQTLDKYIPSWVEAGLQGVEVRHSEHSREDEERYQELAQRYGLIMTGGSDFHGEARKPGIELGAWGVSLDVVREIKDLVR